MFQEIVVQLGKKKSNKETFLSLFDVLENKKKKLDTFFLSPTAEEMKKKKSF